MMGIYKESPQAVQSRAMLFALNLLHPTVNPPLGTSRRHRRSKAEPYSPIYNGSVPPDEASRRRRKAKAAKAARKVQRRNRK